MKQFLIIGVFTASVLSLSAAPIELDMTLDATSKVEVKKYKNTVAPEIRKLAPGITVSSSNGIKKLRTLHSLDSKKINTAARSPRKATKPDGYVLFESFEDWDGADNTWVPTGWTVDMRGEVERAESWTPSMANPMLPAPSDGQYYYGINFSENRQDEWLITPETQIEPEMILSYYAYVEPAFLFSMDNVDWDTYEYIGDKKVAATLQIWGQAEGDEWIMIHDIADDYKDATLMDLLYASPNGLEKYTHSLADFAGKKARFAFRYVGIDGNTMFIDAVGIGYPSLDGVSYMDPFSTLYWGFDRSADLSGLTADIAMYPVYEPLTWTNMSYIDDATYSWEYNDPVTAETVTSDEQEQLTVTYVPDYRSEASLKNNFFYPPVLNATAPHATPAHYSAPYTYFQAGGKFERTLNDGSEFEGCLLPFAFNNRGLAVATVDDPDLGDMSIPVFGHNANTDTYWLNYSLNGETPIEGDYAKLEGIANLLMPTATPLVVNGVTVYGMGVIKPEAELTATIYALNSEMSNDISTFTTVASASIKGSQVIAQYPDGSLGYLCLPFDFDTPAVVAATEEHPAYFVMLQGFNSDQVEYFAPLQADSDDPNYLCLAYTLKHIDLSNHVSRDPYYSLQPVTFIEDGNYVDLYTAFAIGLEAEYPWLTTETNEIKLTTDQPVASIALGSYYDGSALTVDAPAGVNATVTGRYDKCMLTVERNNTDVIVDGNVTVKGPGVEVSIPVKAEAAGIDSVIASDAAIEGIYDLNGRHTDASGHGIYIVKYTDGTVRKLIKK